MIHSQRKGAQGEREWAGKLRDRGYEAHRGQQYCGLEGEDVVSNLPIHWEVKRVQRLQLTDAVDQSKRDAGWKAPAVAHRKNHEEWKVTMPADVFMDLLMCTDMDAFERLLKHGECVDLDCRCREAGL